MIAQSTASILIVACFAGALLTSPVRAGTRIPYGGSFRQEIDTALFHAGPSGQLGGRVSPGKVEAYRDRIRRKLRFVTEHVIHSERIARGASRAKARAATGRTDSAIALEHILDLLDRIESAANLEEAYGIAAEILMIEYATRSFSEPLASLKLPVHVKNLLIEWTLPKRLGHRHADRQASNLVNPATGQFLTTNELAEMIRAGVDLSRLDPPASSPFWGAKDDISKVDILANYLGGGAPVHRGLTAEFPPTEGASFEYRRAHKTQSKPKLDVFYLDEECRRKSNSKQRRCRRKYKLKFGMETNADPVANALLGALGYNADISMHLRKVRIYLGDTSYRELQAEWAGYFDRQRIHLYLPMHRVMLEGEEGHGWDERGEYVGFRECVAEPRFSEITRLGYFSFSSGMATAMREARGLYLFNIWIGNADVKDEANNKLSLRRDANGSWQMYLTQQDLGHAFGLVMPERPNAYPWDVVENGVFARLLRRVRGRVEFNYLNLQDNGLERTTTYADAKWMARLIAQLTREQIEDAVRLGHWPGGIGPLYLEKLINRRNQFVEVFDLEDEYPLISVDRHLTTQDGSVVNGRLVQNRFPESSMRYRQHWRDVFAPAGGYLADMLRLLFQAGVASVDTINPGDIEIGARFVINPRIDIRLSRDIELNPNPQGRFDQYIVRDTMRLGVGVGAGYIAEVDGTWSGTISLAYPAPTRREAIHAKNRTIDFLLPFDVRQGNLPEKFVLLREQSFGFGARVSSDPSLFFVGVGGDLGLHRVRAFRSVIDHREEDALVWLDEPYFFERRLRGFVKIALLEIPFLTNRETVGALEGEAWLIDASQISDPRTGGAEIFGHMVRRGEFRDIGLIASRPARRARLVFGHREHRWNLLLLAWRRRETEDRVTFLDRDGRVLTTVYQAERRARSTWKFIDNGEIQAVSVTGVLGGSRSKPNPFVTVRYRVDDLNTHSDEFDRYYAFLSGLSAGRPFMADDFSAADWEVSGDRRGRWTHLIVDGRIQLGTEALERLERFDHARYWERLAENLGVEISEVERLRARMETGRAKERMKARRRYSDRRLRLTILRSWRLLSLLEVARRTEHPEERLRKLVECLYLASPRRGATFDPIFIATLLEAAGIDELVERGRLKISGRITRTFDDENNLPERRDLVGQLGGARDFDRLDYSFFPFDAVDLYNMLNWVRETQ